MMHRRKPLAGPLLLTLYLAPAATLAQDAEAQQDLDVAVYDEQGKLSYPPDTDRWIMMGANLGGDYADAPFDPATPGTIGVVQMEPAAYDHFLAHGTYADGSMFLLTFYAADTKSQPRLQGFVQGEVTGREIHVIDKDRFEEGRAFFFYREGEDQVAAIAPGSECVSCHEAEGAFDGTFTQFYPVLRSQLDVPEPVSP